MMNKGQADLYVIAGGAVLLLAVIAGLLIISVPNIDNTHTSTLQHFSSYNELYAAFNQTGYNPSGLMRGDMINALAMPTAAGAEKSTASGQGNGAADTAGNYSKTNVQVAGVDEADIVKNDNKYIYAISSGQLYIIDAYPASSAKIVSKLDLNNSNPIEMFISSDSTKLMVFANQYSQMIYYSADGKAPRASFSIARMPWYGGGSTIMAKVFDISDKTNPKLVKTLEFDGSYLNSRLINDKAYFVINSYPHYPTPMPLYDKPMPISAEAGSGGAETVASEGTTSPAEANPTEENTVTAADENNIIPVMSIDGVEQRIATPPEIGIMPRVRIQSFVTIGSLNLTTLEFEKQVVAGSANNLYSSMDNLYLAENVWDYGDYNGIIPMEVGMMVKSIYYPEISSIQKTVVSKFHLSDGSVSFVGSGVVPGTILNQFSMDEYNNNFRIATTTGNNWSSTENQLKNNVYILDADMNMVGALEGLAPQETIYSARFMGDKGYLVTFKTVDPLFVLDLSDPSNPSVLGKLKIPGYSDYMQPIDETHILGIGKDVNELEDAEKVHSAGAVYYTAVKGVKMAIFDVSDVENPKEMYKVVIGDRGTESEALNDHKALLLDMSKNLLVLPITIFEQNKDVSPENYYGGEQTFQGALVYNISLDGGIVEKGRITHVSSAEEQKRGYYYDYTSVIRRSLYMDDILYTISQKMIKANNLSDLSNAGEVLFPQDTSNGNYYGGPVMID